MGFSRATTIDITRPDADTEHSAVMDIDADLTSAFGDLDTLSTIISGKIASSVIGGVSGICDLDDSALVPESRLPTYPVAKLPDGLGYPIGIILPYAAASLSTAMTGEWLECDGSEISRTTYATLFGVIGTRFGYSSSSTFKIPDMRGIFPRGWNHGNSIDVYAEERTDSGDGTTGDNVGTLQDSRNKTHLHYFVGRENVLSNGSDGATGTLYYSPGWGSGPNLGSTGESDFRPINKNVMFVIRVA